MLGQVLRRFGKHGPVLLVGSIGAGLMVPDVSSEAARLLPVSAFLLTLGSFLCAALAPGEPWAKGKLIALGLGFAGAVMPLLTYLLVNTISLEPSIELAVMAASLAPPVGSAAAIAAMLGLRPRLALAISILLTLAAPIEMPISIQLFGHGEAVSFGQVAGRLLLIIGGAALLTLAVVRWREQTRRLIPDPLAGSGIAVIGLIIVGLAVTSGLTPMLARTDRLLALLMLALALNFGAVLLGTLVFAGLGLRPALTIGLVSGNRNVTLAWAVVGSEMPAEAQSYLALCVVAVLSLPLLLRTVMTLLATRSAVQGAS